MPPNRPQVLISPGVESVQRVVKKSRHLTMHKRIGRFLTLGHRGTEDQAVVNCKERKEREEEGSFPSLRPSRTSRLKTPVPLCLCVRVLSSQPEFQRANGRCWSLRPRASGWRIVHDAFSNPAFGVRVFDLLFTATPTGPSTYDKL